MMVILTYLLTDRVRYILIYSYTHILIYILINRQKYGLKSRLAFKTVPKMTDVATVKLKDSHMNCKIKGMTDWKIYRHIDW